MKAEKLTKKVRDEFAAESGKVAAEITHLLEQMKVSIPMATAVMHTLYCSFLKASGVSDEEIIKVSKEMVRPALELVKRLNHDT